MPTLGMARGTAPGGPAGAGGRTVAARLRAAWRVAAGVLGLALTGATVWAQPGTTEAELASALQQPGACGDQGQAFRGFQHADFSPWRLSELKRRLPAGAWHAAVDDLAAASGPRHGRAHAARLGPWLRARWMLDTGQGPFNAAELAEVSACIDQVLEPMGAPAWLLRGRLMLRQHGLDGAAQAVHAFTRAAEAPNAAAWRSEALRRRVEAWRRMGPCDLRLAQYWIRADGVLTADAASASPRAPDDADDDYAGTRQSLASLQRLIDWRFGQLPRCSNQRSLTQLLSGVSPRARQVLSQALAYEGGDTGPGDSFCDPFDHEDAFNPASRASRDSVLHVLGELMKDASRRDRLDGTALDGVLQALLQQLRATLPEAAQRATALHRVTIPLAPSIYLREYECRITSSFGFGRPTTFAIDRQPRIVVSSMALRHALLTSADRLRPALQSPSVPVDALARSLLNGVQRQLAFALAHELAHAYVQGGRNLAVSERALDCAAAVNVKAAFGPDAGLGLFASMADAALEESRRDQWRLWDKGSAESAVERVKAAGDLLATLPSGSLDVAAVCGVQLLP